MTIRKIFLTLLSSLLFTSCVSLNVENLGTALIYSNIKSAADTLEDAKVFGNFKDCYYKVNWGIGNTIDHNLTRPKTIESLPVELQNLKLRRKDIIVVDDMHVDYYVYDKKNKLYNVYSSDVELNYDNISKNCELCKDLKSYYHDSEVSLNNSIYYNKQYLQKSREVPYTAFRSVRHSITVTKYRACYDYVLGITYQEPYNDVEYYYTQEPYTAYRTEYYDVPNLDYSPEKSDKWYDYYEYCNKRIQEIETEIESLDLYDVYFSDYTIIFNEEKNLDEKNL